jgi:hypothetical protein
MVDMKVEHGRFVGPCREEYKCRVTLSGQVEHLSDNSFEGEKMAVNTLQREAGLLVGPHDLLSRVEDDAQTLTWWANQGQKDEKTIRKLRNQVRCLQRALKGRE